MSFVRSCVAGRAKFQVKSDLHIEMLPNKQINWEEFLPRHPEADYLLLAGDICAIQSHPERFREFLTYCSCTFAETYWTAGNHEYYGSSRRRSSISIEECEQLLRLMKWPNVHYLQRESAIINTGDMAKKIQIIGATLWSETKWNIPGINDYNYISKQSKQSGISTEPITHHDTLEWHRRDVAWLRAAIAEARAADHHIIVMTHHLPSMQLIAPQYMDNPLLNTAFASDLDSLVEQADWWVCGHTHVPTRLSIGNCKVIVNPHGYPGERTVVASTAFIEIDNQES